MALLTWQEKYSVGIKEIDNQHKQLIDMINELNDAMLAKRGKEVLMSVLNKLAAYCVTHFTNEEKMMSTHDYPDFAEH